ncbi:hypothetical protein [Fusobacterium necrophorum]|uniref:hypothetical protein n=1 Tax=Fusobacterium necrophorum TaxID=859 RepID=UPI000788A04D|nr:hypothetical protein [Fusobacterium necrophorum]KYM39622.1 hypothetical protein A2U03_06840 [Fusobacterium necrophorum subsp. funduliforme]
MEEKKKRRGYATSEQQVAANKRYRETKKGSSNQNRSDYKSKAKKFVKEFANLKELEELKTIIEKEREEMKMKKWKEIKGSVSLSTDVNVDKDNVGKNGDCIIDIIAGKYKGFSVAGKMAFGEDEDVLIIEDSAVLYDPAE